MARAPFQVLVFPFRPEVSGRLLYAVFQRADDGRWQGIAGGGEDTETPLEAARRECLEEAGIVEGNDHWLPLDSRASIPAVHFKESAAWGEQVYVIPEYAFGVMLSSSVIQPANCHRVYQWVSYTEAIQLLTYDSNRTALWELNQKLLGKGPRE